MARIDGQFNKFIDRKGLAINKVFIEPSPVVRPFWFVML